MKFVRLLIAIAAISLASPPASFAGKTAVPVSDDSITDQVRMKLGSDRDVGAAGIDVHVSNGVVVLTGTVRKDQTKGRAERIAKKVKGVKSVDNKLVVSPLGVTAPAQ